MEQQLTPEHTDGHPGDAPLLAAGGVVYRRTSKGTIDLLLIKKTTRRLEPAKRPSQTRGNLP